MPSKLIDIGWYGERGIVNAIVMRVFGPGTPEGVKQLLHCIQWAETDQNQWIENIASARMVVEVGLGSVL